MSNVNSPVAPGVVAGWGWPADNSGNETRGRMPTIVSIAVAFNTN